MNQQITGVIGWLIIGVLIYVFGRIMRAAGERRGDFEGFARGCCFERELAQKSARHSHDRRHETRTRPEVWFSQN